MEEADDAPEKKAARQSGPEPSQTCASPSIFTGPVDAAPASTGDRSRQLRAFTQVLRAVLAVLVILLVVSYFWPGRQSFLVEMETRGASISFDSSDLSLWRLQAPLLCIRLERGQRQTRSTHPDPPEGCHPDFYDIRDDLTDVVIRWSDGAQTILRSTPGGGLAVDLIATPEGESVTARGTNLTLSRNSRILLTPEVWRYHAALPFVTGNIALGALPTAGEEGILIHGGYQVRQKLLFRPSPVTVDDGSFTIGDRVTFEGLEHRLPLIPKAEGSYRAYGFLAPGGATDGGFRAVAYTALGHTRLQVDRIGVDTAFIDVNWTHRALRDPYLLALTALLGGMELVRAMRIRRRLPS